MALVKKLYDDEARTIQFYPQTHTQAVINTDGHNLDTLLGKKEEITSIIQSSSTTLTAEVGKYYRFDVPVGTLTITLPTMTDTTTVKTIVFYLTAGSTPAVTFTSTHSIYYADGFEIKSGKTYEVNAAWNGLAWIVASITIIVE